MSGSDQTSAELCVRKGHGSERVWFILLGVVVRGRGAKLQRYTGKVAKGGLRRWQVNKPEMTLTIGRHTPSRVVTNTPQDTNQLHSLPWDYSADSRLQLSTVLDGGRSIPVCR